MKKAATILGMSIGVILILLLILPFALKGKVADIVKTEGNKILNANFDFKTLDISLIRNFPSATVSLEDFWLKGNGAFENDTLVKAKNLSATVNLLSLFGNEGYELSSILINKTQIHAIVLENGQVNWDVMKHAETEVKEEPEPTEEASSPFRIKLENVSVKDLSVIYDDRKGNLYAEILDFGGNCSGDFGSGHTLLQLEAAVPSLTFSLNGIPFLNKVNLTADMDIDADFNQGIYTLKENSITLNAIRTNIDGQVRLLADQTMDIDLKLNTNQVGFKEILSLIPAIYTQDFEGLKTEGNAVFTAYAQGKLAGDSIVPQFDANLSIKDASFHYPSLPGGVDHINLEASLKNPGKSLDETVMKIEPFHFILAGNPFRLTAAIKNPISDLEFAATAIGQLDLGKLKEVYPMEDTSLNGKIQADLKIAGKLSDIEKEDFDRIQANGSINLRNMKLELEQIPPVQIQQSTLRFSPRYLKLSETQVLVGDNDLTLDSQFEHYLAFAMQGATLKGDLNVSSNRLDLNDFMTSDSTQIESVGIAADTVAPSKGILQIPANIDFRMQTQLKEVLLDKMRFQNVNGLLAVKDRKVDMKNLSLQTMGGSIVANASYASPAQALPVINGSFALNDINFAQAYKELDAVKQLAPIFNGLKGNFSGKIELNAPLTPNMEVNTQSLQGSGSLSTKDLSLSGVKFIDQVADIVKKPSLKDIKVRNLNLDFTITDGRVTTQPFDLRLADYTMNLSGSTGLDQSIDYKGRITLPTDTGGKIRLSTVDMNIKGTFSSPKVSIDMAGMAKNLAGQLLENLGGSSANEGEVQDTSSVKKKGNILNKAINLFKKKK